jgi:predicted nuclease of predicted toxin-antitoxin system
MRFLADMGISPKTVDFLNALQHDVTHLHDQKLDSAPDSVILKKAREERRILLTHDLDFGELLAASGTVSPSVIIFRLRNMHPDRVNTSLNSIINKHAAILEQGVIISVDEGQIRVRMLPVGSEK